MKIFIKGEYTIQGDCYFTNSAEIISFNVPINNNSADVQVNISPNDKGVQAIQEVEVESYILKKLESGELNAHRFSKQIKTQLLELTNDLDYAMQKTLYAIKSFYNWGELDHSLYSIKDTYWSLDKKQWHTYPRALEASFVLNEHIHLGKENASYIQKYLDGDLWEPFVAFSFLDKAKREPNPVFKWINATIAAELAIKEFFIRYNPQLKSLIMEVPSPPLHKLYGTILKSFIGIESPKKKVIEKGVITRNDLVHKPNQVKIDANKANNYVEEVELAIYHLLSFLYADDLIIKKRLNPIKVEKVSVDIVSKK